MLAQNQAVDWMINNGWDGAWISPIYRQAKKVSEELNSAFEGLFKYNRSDLIMSTPNGGGLQFFSAERYDNIRGFTFDFLIIDEAAHIPEEAWTEVLRATILVRGKKVMFVSTPKGRNWFYNMYNMSAGGYESFTFSSYDNPLIDYKEIDDAKRNLPDHVFKQEYLAEFLEDGSSVFSNVKECVGVAETTSRLYAGVDLGRADDYTVLTILNDKGGMVYIKRWRHMDWLTIIKEVAGVINEYNPITLVEANGVQDAIYESIREKCNIKQNITPFITTSKSKQTIIEDLIVSFEGLDVSILDEEYLVNELNMFTFEYNLKTRTIKYSAPTGQHDDTVMALAIAHHSLKSKRSVGTYSVR